MTTEDLIEEFIDKGIVAYKKLNRNSPEGIKLFRKEPVVIQGVEFSCWREWTCFKMAEYLHDTIPEMYVECNLDGNNSNIVIEVDDKQQQKLNTAMYSYLKTLEK